MRLVLVGGAGFVGSHIVGYWVSGGFSFISADELLVIDNGVTDGFWRLDDIHPKTFRVENLDASDTAALTALLTEDDFVVFLAANPDISKGFSQPRLDFTAGTVVGESLAEACRIVGVKYLFFASGSGVYGQPTSDAVSEGDVTTLVESPYGASKVAVEAMFSAYARMFGMNVGIARFANLVGPKQSHGVAFDFVRKLHANPKALQVLGNGLQTKSYLDISDAIDGVERICQHMISSRKMGEVSVFNLASPDRIQVKEIAEMVLDVMDFSETAVMFEDKSEGWPGDVPNIELDTRSARDTLKWSPVYNSAEALKRAVQAMVNDL
jgi:UDP-glucose 4-epimerase